LLEVSPPSRLRLAHITKCSLSGVFKDTYGMRNLLSSAMLCRIDT
jgi:hypothetical protein